MKKKLLLVLIVFNVVISNAQNSEIVTQIEISRGKNNGPDEWKKDWTVTIFIEDSLVYLKQRNRIKKIENGDSLISLFDFKVIDSVFRADKHCSDIYEQSYHLVYFISEKHRQVSYTYVFSIPIGCDSKDNWSYLNRIYKITNKLHGW